VALGFGASLISIFARLGGGIFTKGADVGGDLVGKVEAGIPEDDPRNPATIADNVGDNVGDCAGMAADLFETYAVTVVATMVLGAIFFAGTDILRMMLYPLAIGGACDHHLDHRHVLRQARHQRLDHGRALQGPDRAGVLSIIGLGGATSSDHRLGPIRCSPSPVAQVDHRHQPVHLRCHRPGRHRLIVVVTEYYTGTNKRPVNSISQASVTGHGTNVIQGLAVSLEATALPALVIVGGIISTYQLAGLFGTGIAVTPCSALPA
jgi:K(+)-stimulated pyrophosphate-energized sodium pump